MRVDPNFMQGGYHKKTSSGEEVVREDLMSVHSQAYGELFARKKKVSSSQLRAFYSDVKALEQKVKMGGEGAFERFYHLVKMLKSRASYIRGKKSGGNVSREFEEYIHTCVDAIEKEKDFEAFLKFFESTVGFYYGAGGEHNR